LVAGAPACGLLVLAAQVVLAAPTGWLAVDGNIRFQGTAGTTYDWANSGAASPTNTCSGAGAVNVSGSGGLFNCGRPGAAGAPPIPPTLTPAAAADPSIISAVFIVDPISTDTTSCGTGDPTIIAGGAKNGDAFTTIGTTSGSVPAKDDLSNVYAVSHTRSDTGHPEMFFAAERLVNNGDSHIDFEFLQSNVGVTAACSGTFTGHRTEGDLLVAVDFTTGGSLDSASVWQWHCNVDPGSQPADGTVCDPGGLSAAHYQQIPTPSFLTLTVNAAGDIPCGGWVCRLGTGATVPQNDFLEGGIDLAGIPFTGCFNSFLPHTRTAQSFTSGLKDFAGPVGFHSCRTPAQSSNSSPSGGGVSPGTAVSDSVTAGNGGAGPTPTGTVTFFLCAPSQLTGGACPSGGTQVGMVKTLVAGAATSDSTSATTAFGGYCWRTQYTPDATSTGVFAPGVHTNSTTECFGVAGAGLPNTGFPLQVNFTHDLAPAAGGLVVPVLMILAVGRRRASAAAMIAVLTLAALSLADAPRPVAPAPSQMTATQPPAVATAQSPIAVSGAGIRTGWRLVIERIGVDALIEPVGLDSAHAMASPSSLSSVGWFSRGPSPGQSGDAVIDGHYGLPSDPAVFRNLHALEPGDSVAVIWPDGRRAEFRVTSTVVIGRDASAPAGLFGGGGAARLSLITCAGAWDQQDATYTQRLIVTAVAIA
jgi:LPXTG-site transpeptidase (sortase) family protein